MAAALTQPFLLRKKLAYPLFSRDHANHPVAFCNSGSAADFARPGHCRRKGAAAGFRGHATALSTKKAQPYELGLVAFL
jgi:hypothetical protein